MAGRALASSAVAFVLILPSAVSEAAPLRFELRFSSQAPGAATGIQTRVVYSDWSGSKPRPHSATEFQLPEGARIHEEAMPVCRASADELFAQGAGACPPETELGTGYGTALTGFGPPLDPVAADVRVFHAPGEFMPVATAPGSDRVLVVSHLRILEARRLVETTANDTPSSAPGGPPDGRTTVKESGVSSTSRGTTSGLITTPRSCPPTGGWTSRLLVTNEDGSVESAVSTTPCRRPLIVNGCLNTDAKAAGKKLGPARLGRKRNAQRKIFKGAKLKARKGLDRYCALGGGSFRIGYPPRKLLKAARKRLARKIKGRVVLILTSSRRFKVKGIRTGDRRRMVHAKHIKVGRNTWYLLKGRKGVRKLVVVRRGKVRAVGIGDSRLTKTKRLTRRYLNAWNLGI